ncbi:restriction endonuclease subunit S [Vibrio vulnificus]|uniref:restriction endonuclease subunit S n=1 Tax=Vibrio vulnificus TaxID=672 RepID=UPI0009BAE4F5|nr:restriction endonuclease subunit S [Vibrio vulnificus]EGQ9277133.1 restriction endonuclease subunit S [Vibrio vulnificus]EGQ9782695.1 restriction endonuclease subunit S [Vibrio vulnificus]EGR0234403.1 restriction endonuclease subunit S [Vibrio vulnificus]EIH0730815.1 restriction endonuclease subunit S [Vibrio vulnificus]EIH1436913.1 restriction endonuclease subunit S [Vibrio vulnificus]
MSWPMVKLGSLCQIVRGSSPRPKGDPRYYGGTVPRLMVGDVTRDGKVVTPKIDFLTGEGATKSRPMKRGDFVVAVSGQPGQPCMLAVDACIHDGFAGLRDLDISRIDKDYLYQFMLYTKHKLSSSAVGAIFKNLTTDQLRELEIPLPPLDEQKRIAAILDKADAIRQKRKQAIVLADEFQRSVFLDMFGSDLVRDSNRVNFGDVTVLDAKMVDPRQDEYLDLLHIGPDRIQKNTGKLLPALTAREEGLISKKFFFNNQYVLYSKIRPYLRKAAIPEFSALCSADMYPVKPIEGKATREFIWMLLLSDLFDNYVASLPDRANIPKLNKKELAAFEFSLPEFEKVKQFSQIVKQNRKGLHSMEVAASTAEINFNALSQKAFSGQL